MDSIVKIMKIKRKIFKRLSSMNIFYESNKKNYPDIIVAGYTRSGTTYIGKILSSLLKLRYIHEPLDINLVKELSYFIERETSSRVRSKQRYLRTLKYVFGPYFRNKLRERGHYFFYKGRLVKLVRANFYLDFIAENFPETKFVVIIRNPLSAIASRVRLNWSIPNQKEGILEIENELSERQREIVYNTNSIHGKLAVSWCLDNFALLKNYGKKNFIFVSYEELVLNPVEKIKWITALLKMGKEESQIIREVNYFHPNKKRNIGNLIEGWKGILSKDEVRDVRFIVDLFNLGFLYDTGPDQPANGLQSPFYKFNTI